MIIAFPILIEKSSGYGRALFVPGIEVRERNAADLFAKLKVQLRERFHKEEQQRDHGALFPLTFSPAIQCKRLSAECELRRRTIRFDLPVLGFSALGKDMTLIPHLDNLLLPVSRTSRNGEDLLNALTKYFRKIEKNSPEALDAKPLVLGEKTSVHYLEVDVPLTRTYQSLHKESQFERLGASTVGDGREELAKNGTSLSDRWPQGLVRAYHREKETRQLLHLLKHSKRKPLLIVGMRKAGKSALFEEAVFQFMQQQQEDERHAYRRGFWKIHTNRMMAGMSHVGDWQKRLMAIAEHAEKEDHTLFFDNLTALFHLGRSAGSTLCMADVLRPFLEQQRFRFVAEATEETLARLRELNRSFCDLFEIIRVPEVDRSTALRILIAATRDIEEQYRINLDVSVIPLAESLQRRFNHQEAVVGGVLDFLRGLADKASEEKPAYTARNAYRRTTLQSHDVLHHFCRLSGFSMEFIDTNAGQPREEIRKALGKEWIGQEAALDALTDTIAVARAGIQDPTKPYGCFLFLGPTGVGKTECAKGLARYLYGNTDRLLRFDMNEFVSPGAAVRLCGSPDAPEGLLTSAIRQQPFAVVLFDEIEKAHPDVYDLLLQVLGEGRLSDALGRTVDFTNTIVILTSNLGVREAARSSGFAEGNDRHAYLDAARRFFRPEFYNRLDAVIPFRRLSREEIGRINGRLLDAFLDRPGFLQRNASLRVSAHVEKWLTDKGYDPVFGARALKRVIEDTLANPVAAALAQHPPTTPVVISVDVVAGALTADARILSQAPPLVLWRPDFSQHNLKAILDACAAHLEEILRMRAALDASPSTQTAADEDGYEDRFLGLDYVTDLYDLRTAISDLLIDCEHERLRPSVKGLRAAAPPSDKEQKHMWWGGGGSLKLWQSMFSASDLNLFLDDLFDNSRNRSNRTDRDIDWAMEWDRRPIPSTPEAMYDSLVELDYQLLPTPGPAQWLLLFDEALADFLGVLKYLIPSYQEIEVEWECRFSAMLFRGSGIEQRLQPFVGTYMKVCKRTGSTRTYQCALFRVPEDETAQAALAKRLADLHPLGPFAPLTFVLRDGSALDLRTGRNDSARAGRFLKHLLPCPAPLKERLQNAGV